MTERGDDWVIVSGASGAIGPAMIGHFLRRGRPVLALDRSDAGFAGLGNSDRLRARRVDLESEHEVVAALDDAIPRDARIGLLVNAVGLIWSEPAISLRGGKFSSHQLDTWHRVIESNLTAAFVIGSRVAARMARKGGGAIVNFSSIAARGNAGQVAYSAAKAGIEGLTRAMAIELGPVGIRVNAVAPGFIDVASTRTALAEGQLQALAAETPLRRLGALEELVRAVDFLAESGFVTGVVLDVNGGLRI